MVLVGLNATAGIFSDMGRDVKKSDRFEWIL